MKYALIGNPNVGKSLIFSQLTGLGVEVSNYPGTTVALKSGPVCVQREIQQLTDLPGVYSLDGTTDEEILVRDELGAGRVDVAIVVMDASHMERNLYLLLQVAEYGVPMVVVANMMDEAEAQGLAPDLPRLGGLLGVEVIPAAATQGRGIGAIMPAATAKARPPSFTIPYDADIEAAIRSLEKTVGATRIRAVLALEGIGTDPALVEAGKTLAGEIEPSHRMSVHQILAANRYHFAREIAAKVIREREPRRGIDPDRLLMHAWPGVPILIAILIGMLVFVFFTGTLLERELVALFNQYLIAPVQAASLPPFAATLVLSVLLAVEAGLAIAFPFVFLFALCISVLEDSGYMGRAAFLADRAMHRLGLHGGAVIPMVLSFGCNVPAVMAMRSLRSRRERIIASFLIIMVPCSARSVVISGIVAAFIGIPAALSVYGIVLALTIATGLFLSRITPGDRFGMILEVPPLRRPAAAMVLRKAWYRVSEFLFLAMPVLILGSVVLGVLSWSGILGLFEDAIAPALEAVLGLPPYAATALIFGILRKEMAFETLVVLAGTADLASVMTSVQLYTFAIISTLFIPCISTIAVLSKQMGSRVAIAVTAYTVALGILIGAAIHMLFG
ncbi:MAG: ferrous iron transport protein B [Methanomicrobiales archaeon]|nr:ferrous iron transport protein B [Methanomicrobiales archaeon]